MTVDEILKAGHAIWGNDKQPLAGIIVRMGKVFGDICRWERNAPKDAHLHTDEELKKELGNIIVSTIRWCNDLGYDPNECIDIAIKAQVQFPKKPSQ